MALSCPGPAQFLPTTPQTLENAPFTARSRQIVWPSPPPKWFKLVQPSSREFAAASSCSKGVKKWSKLVESSPWEIVANKKTVRKWFQAVQPSFEKKWFGQKPVVQPQRRFKLVKPPFRGQTMVQKWLKEVQRFVVPPRSGSNVVQAKSDKFQGGA